MAAGRLDRDVALKFTRALAAIKHSNVVQVFDEGEFLMDDRDAGLLRIPRAREARGHAADLERSLIGLVDAREDLHERALAGTVLAADGVEFATANFERDISECYDTRKPLRDASHHDGWGVGVAGGLRA